MRCILEVVKGLEFLHGKGIVHVDIKHVNVLINLEYMVKLADFGLSQHLNSTEMVIHTTIFIILTFE